MAQTGHRSLTVARSYMRSGSLFLDNAAAQWAMSLVVPSPPDPFYVFLSANQLTVHNLGIGKGRLFSASLGLVGDESSLRRWLEGRPHWRFSARDDADFGGFLSPSGAARATGYLLTMEEEAETVRSEAFPTLPSRRSCLFAFGDEASCHEAHGRHGWNLNEVRPMRLLTEPPLARVARADMELVNIADALYQTNPRPALGAELWRSYWAGDSATAFASRHGLSARPSLWEWLIDGVLEVVDQ